MTYTTGQLIAALDYNTFVQGGAAVNHTVANANTVWGVGNGDKGWGQANPLTAVVGGNNVVTATQWASLISRLNSILTHESGGGTGIAQPTAGTTVAYLAALSSAVTSGYNNRLQFQATGAGSGPSLTTPVWNNPTPIDFQIIRTFTWANADQARYFFNAGGKLLLLFSAVNTGGNAKGADWVTLLNTYMSGFQVTAYSSGRFGGFGGTIYFQNTNLGYWNAGTANNTVLTLMSASGVADYGSNTISIGIKTNGVQGLNGDVGTVLTVQIDLKDAAADLFDDSLNLSIAVNAYAYPPETTNLPTAIAVPTMA